MHLIPSREAIIFHDAVEVLCTDAPKRVMEMERWGTVHETIIT